MTGQRASERARTQVFLTPYWLKRISVWPDSLGSRTWCDTSYTLTRHDAVAVRQHGNPRITWQLGCVHTNRVELTPIQSSQTHKDAAVTLWLTYIGCCGSAYTPAELSHMSDAESRVLMPHVPFSSDFSDRAWWLLSWGRNGCGKAYSLSEGQRGNFWCFALWAPKPRLIASVWLKIAQEMGYYDFCMVVL